MIPNSVTTLIIVGYLQQLKSQGRRRDTNRAFIQKDQSKSIMNNKIFTITLGSRISAFLERRKKTTGRKHTTMGPVVLLHYVTFCYFSNGKFKFIKKQDTLYFRRRPYVPLERDSGNRALHGRAWPNLPCCLTKHKPAQLAQICESHSHFTPRVGPVAVSG